MFCDKCGNTLNENGTCPVCNASEIELVEPVVEPTEDPGKTLGIVALVLGICGLVIGCLCGCVFTPCMLIGLVISIAGIVVGAMGMKKSKAVGLKNTMGMIGLILSIVVTVIGAVLVAIWLISMIASFGVVGIAAIAESM